MHPLIVNYLTTFRMTSSLETSRCAASQKFPTPPISWKRNILSHVDKELLMMPLLSQMNSVDILTFYLFTISFNSYSLQVVFLSTSSHLNPVCLLFYFRQVTCFFGLILNDLIILIITDNKFKSRSSSLGTFVYPFVTSSLLRQIVSAQIFRTSWCLILCSSLKIRDQVLHQKEKIKLYSF